MDATVKQKFVELLKSGEIMPCKPADAILLGVPEGEGRIYGPYGALCELYRRETGEGFWEHDHTGHVHYCRFVIPGKMGGVQFLPPAVATWAGTSTGPRLHGRRFEGSWNQGVDHFAGMLEKTPAEEID